MNDAGDRPANVRCTQCGTEGAEIGFLNDSGQYAAGTTFQAEAAIEVGHHKHWTWHGDFWPYELTF
ncbi:hypothetical protein RA989_20730, partial [Mycobacteroides abscessus subsp. massiliense]